jgi:hypothetical protein
MVKYYSIMAMILNLIIVHVRNGYSQNNTYPYVELELDKKFNSEQRRKEIVNNQELKRKASLLKDNPIKAVLVVGPAEEETKGFIDRMKKVESFLRSKNVEVHCFYYPNSDWESIKKAAADASVFIYSGHGSGTGIKPKEHVSNEDIIRDVKLRKNAVVVFNHVCFGAGSSASDNDDIGLEEAENRVTEYAETFYKIGAGCYFANNYYDSALDFFKNFYSGKTVKQCYELAVGHYNRIEKVDLYDFDSKLKIGISSRESDLPSIRTTYLNDVKIEEEVPAKKGYDIAFVSKLDFKLENMLIKLNPKK